MVKHKKKNAYEKGARYVLRTEKYPSFSAKQYNTLQHPSVYVLLTVVRRRPSTDG
jgi:hypothetical protein